MRGIGLMGKLEPERFPLLDTNIDQVRFPTTLSDDLAEILAQLNDPANGHAPTDVSIPDLARQLLWNMRWHVSEG